MKIWLKQSKGKYVISAHLTEKAAEGPYGTDSIHLQLHDELIRMINRRHYLGEERRRPLQLLTKAANGILSYFVYLDSLSCRKEAGPFGEQILYGAMAAFLKAIPGFMERFIQDMLDHAFEFEEENEKTP